MDPFVGEIRLLPYSFAPKGWALCNGQLLPVATHIGLFGVLGTTYGGDGKSTFALPDLQGYVVPGTGQGPGLRNWKLGMSTGESSVTLEVDEMPGHTHNLNGLDVIGGTGEPSPDTYLAKDRRGGQGNVDYLAPSGTPLDVVLSDQALSLNGGSLPHENRQPVLCLNFCIAMVGVVPPRS